MAVRIDKIYIKNFKVFKEYTFDFSKGSLVVFDGPNGFGKTSIYDALELVFTGKILRYVKLVGLLIDKRESKLENPLLHENHDDGNIIIKVSFQHNDQQNIWAIWNNLAEQPGLNFNNYQLHELEHFDDQLTKQNIASDRVREDVLGPNYYNDFKFINYVEQEDTFSFLRSPEKEKRSGIDYLFNTDLFQENLAKFKKIDSRLYKLLSGYQGLTQQTEELKRYILDIESKLKNSDETEFEALFSSNQFDWDLPEIDFNVHSYDSIMGSENGVLTRLGFLINNQNNFLSYYRTQRIDGIIKNRSLLEQFFFYYHFLQKQEGLFEDRVLFDEIDNFIHFFEEVDLPLLLSGEVELPSRIDIVSKEAELIKKYRDDLSTLRTLYNDSNSITKIHAKINSSRNQLINHIKKPDPIFQIDEGFCPLCGHDHGNLETLLESIESQTEDMLELNSSIDNRLETFKEDFLNFINNSLIPELKTVQEKLLYDPEYFKQDFFNRELQLIFNSIQGTLDKLGINYRDHVQKTTDRNPETFEGFIVYLSSYKEEYEEDPLLLQNEEDFKEYFNEDFELLNGISAEDLANKKAYVNWRFSIFQNDLLNKQRENLSTAQSKLQILNDFHAKVKEIIKSMETSLTWYNKELTKDIELLFHIYFGRIAQDFQGGIGLFIDNRDDKLKFISTPRKSFDAIFSLSTGQLTALILSFTLALNKKYSKSKLLFIDDPIQSMDDINVAGFVELLRNEFSDRHIFLSTHEMKMSTYLRYKFEKFNLSTQRIDLSSTLE